MQWYHPSMPSRMPPQVRAKLEPIRLLVLDVDGVLTDGAVLVSAEGETVKSFSVRDGLGMRLLLDSGFEIGVITGRSSPALSARCPELGLRDYLVFLGIASQRIQIISYGEEKPFALGSNEGSWKLNRRAHFLIVAR